MIETVYQVPGFPTGLRLCLLADFHNKPNQFIIDSLKRNRPDLICIAGDAFYSTHPLANQVYVLPLLEACVSIAPTFLSLGNHEHAITELEIKQIENTGTVVLDNTWIKHDGLVIGGLSSGYVTAYRAWRATHPNAEKPSHGEMASHDPDLSWLKEYAAVPGYHILLSHHPEYWREIKEKKIELTCCGHCHGGQWRVGKQGLFAPGQGWMPKWTKGVYDGRLIVSAGLTNTAPVPRIFNPTEVVYIEEEAHP